MKVQCLHTLSININTRYNLESARGVLARRLVFKLRRLDGPITLEASRDVISQKGSFVKSPRKPRMTSP